MIDEELIPGRDRGSPGEDLFSALSMGRCAVRTERIDVISYSGRKAEERPLTFILRGLRIDVVEITDRWIEEGVSDRVRRRFFRVRGSDGGIHRICYDESLREWQYTS
jgi:hypothetical protein